MYVYSNTHVHKQSLLFLCYELSEGIWLLAHNAYIMSVPSLLIESTDCMIPIATCFAYATPVWYYYSETSDSGHFEYGHCVVTASDKICTCIV